MKSSWWWLVMLKLDPLSFWQTCSSCVVLRRLLCIMRSSPPCRLCVQWVKRRVIAIIRLCMCLPGVYGLFYAVSIPYHHGQVTLKSFIIHVTPKAMNCPIISAALCIWCSWSDFFFFSISRSHRAFLFCIIKMKYHLEIKIMRLLVDSDTWLCHKWTCMWTSRESAHTRLISHRWFSKANSLIIHIRNIS